MIGSLVIGPAGHGVVRLATATAAGVVCRAETPGELRLGQIAGASAVHVHYTDRLFGDRCEEAADRFRDLVAGLPPAVVTLHDLPMPGQGVELYRRRCAAYRRVAAAAAATVVSSHHEARLLSEAGATPERVRVVPLPIDRSPDPISRPITTAEVGVLGWIYPGKGHETVLRALPAGTALVALGAASPGHEHLLADLDGPQFRSTGFLPDRTLRHELQRVGVPVAPSRAISASASIGSWLEAGRRPIVLDGPWVRELDQRCPGSVTIVTPETLGDSIGEALAEPDSTWLGDTPVGPTSAEITRRLQDICREVAG